MNHGPPKNLKPFQIRVEYRDHNVPLHESVSKRTGESHFVVVNEDNQDLIDQTHFAIPLPAFHHAITHLISLRGIKKIKKSVDQALSAFVKEIKIVDDKEPGPSKIIMPGRN